MRLDAWAKSLAADLEATGVPVAIDPRDVRTPGALLSLASVHPDRIGRSPVTVIWRVTLIAQAAGIDAYRALGEAAEKLWGVARPDESRVTAETVGLNESPAPLPALIWNITTECED